MTNLHEKTHIHDAEFQGRNLFELYNGLQIVCELATVQCKIKAIDSRIMDIKESLKEDDEICRTMLQVLNL